MSVSGHLRHESFLEMRGEETKAFAHDGTKRRRMRPRGVSAAVQAWVFQPPSVEDHPLYASSENGGGAADGVRVPLARYRGVGMPPTALAVHPISGALIVAGQGSDTLAVHGQS